MEKFEHRERGPIKIALVTASLFLALTCSGQTEQLNALIDSIKLTGEQEHVDKFIEIVTEKAPEDMVFIE